MAYPPGASCLTPMNTAAFVIIGPGVTSASGFPPGLSFPGIFGPDYITGTPTTPGVYQWTVNGDGVTSIVAGDNFPKAIVPQGATAPSSGNVILTAGVPSTGFVHLYETTDGGVTWTLITGTFYFQSDVYVSCGITPVSMPAGLTFHADGTITGTPTVPGFTSIPIGGYDVNFKGTTSFLNIAVNPSSGTLDIVCASPPDGIEGIAYTHTFPASGGTPPYSFAITVGALPNGLTLDAATGIVSGTPTLAGVFPFTIEVTDSVLATASVPCSITIAPATATLTIICDSPPAGNKFQTYVHTFPATGGLPPYSFAITSGALPDGLTLDTSSGIVGGLPTMLGVFNFRIQVTDSLAQTAFVDCSITIATITTFAIQLPQQAMIPIPLPDPTRCS